MPVRVRPRAPNHTHTSSHNRPVTPMEQRVTTSIAQQYYYLLSLVIGIYW